MCLLLSNNPDVFYSAPSLVFPPIFIPVLLLSLSYTLVNILHHFSTINANLKGLSSRPLNLSAPPCNTHTISPVQSKDPFISTTYEHVFSLMFISPSMLCAAVQVIVINQFASDHALLNTAVFC